MSPFAREATMCMYAFTCVCANRHGQVPQLVLPFTAEQALWGDTLTYKGVGLSAGLGLLQEAEAEEVCVNLVGCSPPFIHQKWGSVELVACRCLLILPAAFD